MDKWNDAEMLRRMNTKLDLLERRIEGLGNAVCRYVFLCLALLIYLVWVS